MSSRTINNLETISERNEINRRKKNRILILCARSYTEESPLYKYYLPQDIFNLIFCLCTDLYFKDYIVLTTMCRLKEKTKLEDIKLSLNRFVMPIETRLCENGISILQYMLQNRRSKEVIKEVLKYVSDPAFKDLKGRNALHTALLYNYGIEIIEMLISKGFPIDEKDDYGSPPLHYCVKNIYKCKDITELIDVEDTLATLPNFKGKQSKKEKKKKKNKFLKIKPEIADTLLKHGAKNEPLITSNNQKIDFEEDIKKYRLNKKIKLEYEVE